MTTLWDNQNKRMVGGESSILMNDTVEIFDSTTALFGGANPPTVWVNQVKTS